MIAHWTKAFHFGAVSALIIFIQLPVTVSADSTSGNLDAGKTVLVMTGTWTGSDAGTTEMRVCTKRAASYALSDMAGTWGMNNLASGPGAPWWHRGTLTVDSSGNYAMSAVESDGSPDSGSGTMSLLPDSSFVINEIPGGKFRMDSGKTVVVGTSTWTDYMAGTTELPILTKKAASYSTGDLPGAWQVHTLASGPGAPNWVRSAFSFTNGAFTFTKVENDGDTGSGSGTMAITTDGVMTIPGDPEPFQCHMDADKTVAVCTNTWLTGGIDNGTTSMGVGVKRAASYSSADLVGTWDCNTLASGPGEPWWERATITIGADGTFSGSATDSSPDSYSIGGTMALSESGIVTPLMPGQFLLTAGASGIGGGSVSSGDGALYFAYPASNEGVAAVDPSATVTLSATADNISTASWSGDCTSTGGSPVVATCTISAINGAKNVSVIFARRAVRIAETLEYYPTIQSAYDEATNNQSVQIQATNFNENLILANPDAVSLKGGYNSDFSSNSSWSTVSGTVTISGGPVTIENLAI